MPLNLTRTARGGAAVLLAGLIFGCGSLRTDNHVAVDKPIQVDFQRPLPIAASPAMPIAATQPLPITIAQPVNIQVKIQSGIAYKGVYISAEMMDLVKIYTTRGDYVLAVFGPPTQRSKLDDGTEIWRWTYEPVEEVSPMVSLLKHANGDTSPATHVTAFVHLRNGIVIEKFRG